MAAWGARDPLAKLRPPVVVGQRSQPLSGAVPAAPRVAAPAQSSAEPLSAEALGWAPPPIPTGAYNPIRAIEESAGKRGLGNTLEDLSTKDARGASEFALEEGEVGRQKSEQEAEAQKDLATIAQSYQRLGVKQTEQARGAGVLRGGALLQSAAKRAANEGKSKEPVTQGLSRQEENDQRSLGKLALGREQEQEDIAKEAARAEREQAQFGIDTRTLEAREAAENGYVSPVSHISDQSKQGAGFVIVGGPQKKQRR